MQLKGTGRTPDCRGDKGRAVLRSSVRELLAQGHIHALRVPTSRALSLILSTTQGIQHPGHPPLWVRASLVRSARGRAVAVELERHAGSKSHDGHGGHCVGWPAG